MSSFHQKISPGVMTPPNMSRPGLRSSSSFHQKFAHTPLRNQGYRVSTPNLNFSESPGSDSDEVDNGRATYSTRTLTYQMEPQNNWMRVTTLIWTSVISILTFVLMLLRSISHNCYAIFSRKKKPAHVLRQPRYYSYRPQHSSLISRMWSPVQGLFSETYNWISQSLFVSSQSSRSHTLSSSKPRCCFIPLLCLVPFLIFIGWWFWQGDSSPVREKVLPILNSAGEQMWVIVTYPFDVILSILLQVWTVVVFVISVPFSILPSFESFGVILYDICFSPIKLLLSIMEMIMYYVGNIISLFQMLLYPILNSKIDMWDTSSEELSGSGVQVSIPTDTESNSLKAFLQSALQKQEAFLLSKLSASEQNLRAQMLAHQERLRAELAAKDGYGQKLNAKVAYLQDELQHLRRRFVMSFRRSGTIVPDASTFLAKDVFEKALANMKTYFNEELERRSSMMAEEINARIARQSQIHLSQMSQLQMEFSDLFRVHGELATSIDESLVRQIVHSVIALYEADKTGMVDFALESQGGQVVSTRCTETYQVKSPTLSVFGVPLWYRSNSPRTVIQPDMHPGECWAFVGSQGFLVIQLSHRIHVKGLTYEHVSPVLLPTGKIDSAPKDFSVYGLRAEGDNDPILLGNYHYLQNSTSMQYFPVQRSVAQPLQLIEIQVKSNHGNINYTCMYRIRVHGSIA